MPGPTYWLPAEPDPSTTSVEIAADPTAIQIQTIDWSKELIHRTAATLRLARRRHLAHLPLDRILELIDGVAGRFLDPSDPIRQEALVSMTRISGLSAPMADRVLDGMARDWRRAPLEFALRSEFGDPSVLDRFVDTEDGRSVHAVAPELCFHVFSGNVPGVAVMSLIRALLVRSASLAKTAAGEPMLPVLFARGLAEADAGVGECLGIGYWKGGEEELERTAIEHADLTIAYGSDRSIEAIRGRLPPDGRIVAYGTRFSAAVVLREALDAEAAETARAAAEAVAMFDQQGCVSPHVILVEVDGVAQPARWAELLAEALAAVEHRLPRGPISEAEAAAIQQARARAEFAALGGGETGLIRPLGTEWTVIIGPGVIEASCLNRTIRVIPIADLAGALDLLRPIGSVLQSVGYAGPGDRMEEIAPALARIGASRIVPLDRLPWPIPAWHHDGGQPLRDLVRWCDLEKG